MSDPTHMTVQQFLQWRIASERAAGRTWQQIARGLGVSRITLWRMTKCFNLKHGDNCNLNDIDLQPGQADTDADS